MQGNCPPGAGNEWGQPPIQAPRPSQPPSQPIQAPPSSPNPSGPDYDKLADLIVGKMAGDERFRGPAGKDGEPGKDGADGQPGTPGKDAVLDHDALAKSLISKLPPVVLQYLDKNGQVVEEQQFAFGQPIKIPPLLIETYDKDGKFQDSDAYPYTFGVKLKPIVIPPQKGT